MEFVLLDLAFNVLLFMAFLWGLRAIIRFLFGGLFGNKDSGNSNAQQQQATVQPGFVYRGIIISPTLPEYIEGSDASRYLKGQYLFMKTADYAKTIDGVEQCYYRYDPVADAFINMGHISLSTLECDVVQLWSTEYYRYVVYNEKDDNMQPVAIPQLPPYFQETIDKHKNNWSYCILDKNQQDNYERLIHGTWMDMAPNDD